MRGHRITAAVALLVCALGIGASAIDLGQDATGEGEEPMLAGMLGLPIGGEPETLDLHPPNAHKGAHKGGDKSDRLLVSAPGPYFAPKVTGDGIRALAYEFNSRVYSRPDKRPRAIGIVRRGSTLLASQRAAGPGCRRGIWYELAAGGFVCTRDGFSVAREDRALSTRQVPPDVTKAMPFQYGRVTTREAFRFYRIPKLSEEEAIARAVAEESSLPDVVEKQLDGDYFVAIDRLERAGDREFYRTIRGRYLRKQDVDLRPEPAMRGELLDEDTSLPLAFVFGDAPGAPRLKQVSGRTETVGTAHVHARFPVREVARWDGREVVVGPGSLAVPREHVRLARRRQPPDSVEPGAKWVHIDLDEQTLVAYQGERPVFATLISSGLEDDYATPAGLFRIHEKHITTTMRGSDPVEGPYEVGDVPWTMFYWKSYALHGAYWHDTFGRVRSHGCTNLSPIDARWLFHFTADEVPAGWHARRQLEQGTWVWFTRGDPDGEADS